MDFIEIRINKDEVINWLREKIDGLPSRAADMVLNILNLYAEIARILSPHRTGELSQSHRVEHGGLQGSMIPTAAHAIYVIMGTDPHPILPVNKKALYWPGAEHPVRRVEHPGTRANDYIADVIPAGDPGVDRYIHELGDWLVA